MITPILLNNKDSVNSTIFKLLFFTTLVFVVLFGLSSLELGRNLLLPVNQSLRYLVGHTVVLVSSVFSGTMHFDSSRLLLIEGSSEWSIYTIERTYPIYIVAVLLIAFLPAKKIASGLVYALLTVIFIIICSTILSFFRVYLYGSIHFVWSLPVEKSIFLPLYFWIFYIAKNNEVLTGLLSKVNARMLNISYFTVQNFLLILILFNALPFIALRYMGDSIPFITATLLNTSQYILSIAGYSTSVIGNKIFMDESWIKIDPTCIGVGLWVLVVFMIVNMRGSILNKLLYLPVFTVVFSLTNSFRLAYALREIHLSTNVGVVDYIGLHNKITYIMYIVSFVFFILYIFWFHNLKLVTKTLKSH